LFEFFTNLTSEALALQPDGKLLTLSAAPVYTAPAVVRFNADGSMDRSFGPFGDGRSAAAIPLGGLSGVFYAVTLDSNGRIVAAGYSQAGSRRRFLVARYDDAGCSGIGSAKLKAKKISPPAGDDSLKLKGTAFLEMPAPLDPAANGIRLILADSSGYVFSDATIPGGAGWNTKGSPPAGWKYSDPLGVQGFTTVSIKRDRRVPGLLRLNVKAKNADFEALDVDVVVTVVFDVASPVPVQCAVAQWPGLPDALQECTGPGDSISCQ
jgi:hypothetical protein